MKLPECRCSKLVKKPRAKVAGWWFQTCFSPLFGESIQFDEHIFQMGWFNHQPDKLCQNLTLGDLETTWKGMKRIIFQVTSHLKMLRVSGIDYLSGTTSQFCDDMWFTDPVERGNGWATCCVMCSSRRENQMVPCPGAVVVLWKCGSVVEWTYLTQPISIRIFGTETFCDRIVEW